MYIYVCIHAHTHIYIYIYTQYTYVKHTCFSQFWWVATVPQEDPFDDDLVFREVLSSGEALWRGKSQRTVRMIHWLRYIALMSPDLQAPHWTTRLRSRLYGTMTSLLTKYKSWKSRPQLQSLSEDRFHNFTIKNSATINSLRGGATKPTSLNAHCEQSFQSAASW